MECSILGATQQNKISQSDGEDASGFLQTYYKRCPKCHDNDHF